jgi:iron complex transport system substrate-binding protein
MQPATTAMYRLRVLTLLLAVALVASACGDVTAGGLGAATEETEGAGVNFPLTVENCGEEVTFSEPPDRVVLVNSAPVPALQGLGVMDRVVARAGAFPDEYYDEQTRAALAGIPSLGDELDASGHLQINQEIIISQMPDLLLGLPDGITRPGLAAVGIPVIVEPAFCPEGIAEPGFDDIYAQIEFYGQVFDRQDAAATAVADLRERVDGIQAAVEGSSERTAATLFPTVGGGTVYAYGTKSMAHPQMETAGFVNVFGHVDDRVFEVTLEELLERDPDVLILLHVDGEPGPVKDAVVSLPGADQLTAVRNDDILVQLFNFTEPPRRCPSTG